MVKILSAILMFAFCIQTFQKGFIILGYHLNAKTLAQNCENKFRPALKCEGRCIMMKKLLAEQKKEEKNPELKFENKYETLYDSNFTTAHSDTAGQNLIHFAIPANSGTVINRSFSPFHPPSIS